MKPGLLHLLSLSPLLLDRIQFQEFLQISINWSISYTAEVAVVVEPISQVRLAEVVEVDPLLPERYMYWVGLLSPIT
jgi:hypothetical protein